MALINSDDKHLVYQYKMKKFSIHFTNSGDIVELREPAVRSLVIINDYMTNMFPIMQLKLSMSAKLYYRILRNKDNVRFIMNIQKYYTGNSKKEKSLYEEYINASFSLILDDSDEDLYESVRKKNNGDEQKEDDLKEQANEIEFYIFRSDLIKASKGSINLIIENCTITNALAYILGEMKCDDVLMSKADNVKMLDEIRIPPMKYSEAFRYLDTFYGIYKTGAIIYFGVNRSYIIKYEGACTAYEEKEHKQVTIIIPEAGSSTTQSSCSLKKADHSRIDYLIGDYDTVEFSDKSTTDKVLNGSEIEIINSNAGTVESSAKSSSDSRTILENNGMNPYFKSIYQKLKNSLKKVITVEFSDIDVSVLEPNKKFNFVFEDTSLSEKYKGSYILGRSEIGLFHKGSDMEVTAKCTFYSD